MDFCRPRATWSVTDWRRVIFSDESRFSLRDDDHRTRGGGPASGPIRHLLSSGIQQFQAIRCDSVGSNFWDTRSSLVVLKAL
ncbi:hypothetical protein TNCV_654711 [Trichonephila clavipes]|nr:hypothetical protein TNCV_654711 [Trichonephila clavipes]